MPRLICNQDLKIKIEGSWLKKQMVKRDLKPQKKDDVAKQPPKLKESWAVEIHSGIIEPKQGGSGAEGLDKQIVEHLMIVSL